MKVIRSGITRIVFSFDTVVIKIPNFSYSWRHFLQGLIANINERITWECSIVAETSHLLAPVLWASWGGWILVMRKAQLVTDEYWGIIDISEHKKHYGGDDKVCNYGVIDNILVKIDYGN